MPSIIAIKFSWIMQIKFFTIPNLLTLSNLMCGSFAAVSVLAFNNLTWAFWLVIAAAIFDFFDGFMARLLHCPSPIGGELDSLADMVSFGFVPAAVAYKLFMMSELPACMPQWMMYVGVVLCFSIAAFSALRLAKFNIDETQHTEFCGLPTPANALFFVALGLIKESEGLIKESEGLQIGWWIAILALLMGLMLIAPVRMFALKVKGFGWKGNEIRYIFLIISAVMILILRTYSIPAIILLYIAISMVRWVLTRSKNGENA